MQYNQVYNQPSVKEASVKLSTGEYFILFEVLI